jgi:N6-adenosine-specific RNA methylase IME4
MGTGLRRGDDFSVIKLGAYTLTPTGLEVHGRPSFAEHESVGLWIRQARRASGFWAADWLRYGESRADWAERLSQLADGAGVTAKTAANIRAVGAIAPSRRRDDVEFALHETVAPLRPDEQTYWLNEAATHGWTQRDLRLSIRASKRRRVIEGQAVLSGLYRVIYADCPWRYSDRPPSGSGAAQHYEGMTIEQLCALPVEAHAYPDAVLFFWVTAPMLEQAFPIIKAWGFTYKTGCVWDKVLQAGGHYVAVRHEHLLIATRGSCTPDRPVPMPDSVLTERRGDEHSGKPESMRKMIEGLYDGPYLELFGRERVDGWDVFGNDAALWHQLDVRAAQHTEMLIQASVKAAHQAIDA